MTESDLRQIGELTRAVRDLEHRIDRFEDGLMDWMERHERDAGRRDQAISHLQQFRAQVAILATLGGGLVALLGQHLLSH